MHLRITTIAVQGIHTWDAHFRGTDDTECVNQGRADLCFLACKEGIGTNVRRDKKLAVVLFRNDFQCMLDTGQTVAQTDPVNRHIKGLRHGNFISRIASTHTTNKPSFRQNANQILVESFGRLKPAQIEYLTSISKGAPPVHGNRGQSDVLNPQCFGVIHYRNALY